MKDTYNVLFLCTGNSARSIMAEAVANHIAGGKLRAFSAGSQPAGKVQSLALQVLEESHIPANGARSKSWDEFSTDDAPEMDLIITVCDKAAGEACPFWPGQPMTAHWGIGDPVQIEGDEETRRKAYGDAMTLLRHRISLLLSLKPEAFDRLTLQNKIREIGQVTEVSE